MEAFDPLTTVENCQLILDQGKWPNFHDAEVHNLNIWRGDVRPHDDVWIGPMIEITFELCALKNPFIAVLKFYDCEAISLQEYNQKNAIYDLRFEYQSRGELLDGNPMTPYIFFEFESAFGVGLSFKCYRVEVIDKKYI